MEDGEQESQPAKIGKVFLIDRGEIQPSFLPSVGLCRELLFILSNMSPQMWILSLHCAHKSFMKDSWMTYSGSNVVSTNEAGPSASLC